MDGLEKMEKIERDKVAECRELWQEVRHPPSLALVPNHRTQRLKASKDSDSLSLRWQKINLPYPRLGLEIASAIQLN